MTIIIEMVHLDQSKTKCNEFHYIILSFWQFSFSILDLTPTHFVYKYISVNYDDKIWHKSQFQQYIAQICDLNNPEKCISFKAIILGDFVKKLQKYDFRQ